MPGPPEQYDAEAMFLWWYNDGERRTLAATAEQFGAGYTTVKDYADKHDWDGRADEIDQEARKALAKRMGRILAKQRSVEVDALRAVTAKFLKRLPDQIDGRPNPDLLGASDISLRDFIEAAKAIELLLGGATERVGQGQEHEFDLAAIEAEIAALDEAALQRGDTFRVWLGSRYAVKQLSRTRRKQVTGVREVVRV